MKFSQPLLRLLKKSAKKSFQLLRAHGPYTCSKINSEVSVTKVFFDHIAHNPQKKRRVTDYIERLLIIPFIADILEHGSLMEERTNADGSIAYKVSLKQGTQNYSVVVLSTAKRTFLLSCFIDTESKK